MWHQWIATDGDNGECSCIRCGVVADEGSREVLPKCPGAGDAPKHGHVFAFTGDPINTAECGAGGCMTTATMDTPSTREVNWWACSDGSEAL